MAETTETPETGTENEDPETEEPVSAEEAKRMRAALKKANSEAAGWRKKAAEYEDKDKTEAQKRADAEKQAAESSREAMRLRVAIRYELDEDLVDRLKGTTVEEIEADAKTLAEKFGKTNSKKQAPSFDGGPRDNPPADPKDMNSIIGQMAKRR